LLKLIAPRPPRSGCPSAAEPRIWRQLPRSAALALASACLESQAVEDARKALDRAVALAPDWEAAHYEDGKFWLACEDLERACAAFDRACRAMPRFTAAWSNLGATLGELDRPGEALAAFQRALRNGS
jgi:tetratricopeptide (TPR) repeat protein